MSSAPEGRGAWAFGAESRGDPLERFPALRRDGLAYNEILTERVLRPLLERWTFDQSRVRPDIANDFERVSGEARALFQDWLPAIIGAGDAAVAAALGVTANFQRTAALVGEFVAAGGPLRPAQPEESAAFPLSRFWCGLIEYPADTPYFDERPHPPEHASSLGLRLRDTRHVANALWTTPRQVRRQCDEALEVLGREVRASGIFEPGDLKHLQTQPVPNRFRDSRKRGSP